MAGKFTLWLYILLLIWIGLGVISLYIPPHIFWPAGFVAYSLPIALFFNLVFLGWWLLRFSWKAVLALALTIALFGLYSRSFKILFSEPEDIKSATSFKLLSYNVRSFNIFPTPKKDHLKASGKFLSVVAELEADILCLQEFYNYSKKLKSTERLSKLYPHHYFSISSEGKRGNQYGLAIFSKFPIIKKGTIAFGELNSNHAMFADIKVYNDTIRVYNFHLQSMAIRREIIPEINDNKELLRSKGSSLYKRLRFGFVTRGKQINSLRNHIDSSPYPVIATGDLNDLPHSYTYEYMRKNLKNSFEEAGSGLGTTFAGGFLPFLRIDNQFVSTEIEVIKFETLDTIRYSDHLPTFGIYSVGG